MDKAIRFHSVKPSMINFPETEFHPLDMHAACEERKLSLDLFKKVRATMANSCLQNLGSPYRDSRHRRNNTEQIASENVKPAEQNFSALGAAGRRPGEERQSRTPKRPIPAVAQRILQEYLVENLSPALLYSNPKPAVVRIPKNFRPDVFFDDSSIAYNKTKTVLGENRVLLAPLPEKNDLLELNIHRLQIQQMYVKRKKFEKVVQPLSLIHI
eukprot:TRINITY_DN878_c0_g1_i1.p1 TRINITY_DN878_c0_g1~~TRINITY_DN878_c0_g1_i1.p1  ORF type:complete len:213 (+),score=23.39 TRINITY_DN878_c0_g1_i1:42-680(+)